MVLFWFSVFANLLPSLLRSLITGSVEHLLFFLRKYKSDRFDRFLYGRVCVDGGRCMCMYVCVYLCNMFCRSIILSESYGVKGYFFLLKIGKEREEKGFVLIPLQV